VIPVGQSLCVEADSHTIGITFYGQLRSAAVFTGLDTDPVEFTPHLHNRTVLRYVVFMLPSVSTFLKWSLLYSILQLNFSVRHFSPVVAACPFLIIFLDLAAVPSN
jgi:hypothetical protein